MIAWKDQDDDVKLGPVLVSRVEMLCGSRAVKSTLVKIVRHATQKDYPTTTACRPLFPCQVGWYSISTGNCVECCGAGQ